MRNKVRVGIVGCGAIVSMRHIPAFLKLKESAVLQAVCDKNEDLARSVASANRIPAAYSSSTEMLEKEKLDIIDICTPPQIHAALALEAIEKGCHVIMEKPMALKSSDCDRMIEAAAKRKVKLCVIHNDLFHPPFLKAKRLVADGAIGDFVGMRIFLSTPRWDMIDLKDHWYHKLPGGVLGETGPHMAYMSLEFLRRITAVDVHATSVLKHPWAPFDEFRIELEGDGGLSSVALSYTRRSWEATVDIIGAEAGLHVDLNSMLLIRHRLERLSYLPIARASLSTVSQVAGGIVSNVFNVATGRQKLGTDLVIEKFLASVSDDSPPPVTGEEGRETVRVMEMVVAKLREKASGGKCQNVPSA